MRLSSTVLAISLGLPFAAQAQTSAEGTPPATEAAPTLAPAPATATAPVETVVTPTPAAPPPAAPAVPPPIAFGWEALVDAYYLYNFTGDPKTEGPRLRQFDTTANNFALNYAKLGVHADTDLVSFRMDLGGGHTAAIINAASAGNSAAGSVATQTDTASLYGNGFLVQQAFATVRITPQVSLDAGKFVTSASAEVIESNKNWLYSRSLLFFGVPLLHTGLRINAAPIGTLAAPELVLSLQIVNGWNNDPDINSDKTYGINVTYTPANMGLTASVTSYIGKEVAGSDTAVLVDGVFLKDIGNLSVGVNLDYFKVGTPYWLGVAGMGRYILNDSFTLAARAEYLKSKNGYSLGATALDGSLYEFTGMGAWTVGKHYELRLEIRADMSNQEIFDKGGTARKNQVTGLLGALAYF